MKERKKCIAIFSEFPKYLISVFKTFSVKKSDLFAFQLQIIYHFFSTEQDDE